MLKEGFKWSQVDGALGRDLVRLEYTQIHPMNDSSHLRDLMLKQASMIVDHRK